MTLPTACGMPWCEPAKPSADLLLPASASHAAAVQQRVGPHRSKLARLPRRTAEQSAAAAPAPAATSKARTQLARQVESRVYGGHASQSNRPNSLASETRVPTTNVASAKGKLFHNFPAATAATPSTERARLALADKIVERVLADDGEDESDDDHEGHDAGTQARRNASLSPNVELSENAFLSREKITRTPPKDVKITRTPPKDVYAHTVQQVAISEDDEDVEIVTVDGRNDVSRISETEDRRGSTYAESFRAYLRDNNVFGLHATHQSAALPSDGVQAVLSKAADTDGTVFGDLLFEKRSVLPSQIEKEQPVLTVRDAKDLVMDSAIGAKQAETNERTYEGSSSLASPELCQEKTASITISDGIAADNAMQVYYKETVKEAYLTANGEGGSQAPLIGHSLALPLAHREEAGECIESLAENERDANGKPLDQLADETPRVPMRFVSRIPPSVPPPASSMARLSLTPSSRDSSILGSPRNTEFSDDHSVADSVKGMATDGSPTTEDLFKRLQELKLQAARSLAGTTLAGNNSLAGDSHLEGMLISEKSFLFDEDASLLNESLGLSTSPSISSPLQR